MTEHGKAHDTEVRITVQCLPGALWLFQLLVNLNLPSRHTSKAQSSQWISNRPGLGVWG